MARQISKDFLGEKNAKISVQQTTTFKLDINYQKTKVYRQFETIGGVSIIFRQWIRVQVRQIRATFVEV
jgi:hypothetical protein